MDVGENRDGYWGEYRWEPEAGRIVESRDEWLGGAWSVGEAEVGVGWEWLGRWGEHCISATTRQQETRKTSNDTTTGDEKDHQRHDNRRQDQRRHDNRRQ